MPQFWDSTFLGHVTLSRSTIDWVIGNLHFELSVNVLPDENIGKNLEEFCIRQGNLKYIDEEIVDANL